MWLGRSDGPSHAEPARSTRLGFALEIECSLRVAQHSVCAVLIDTRAQEQRMVVPSARNGSSDLKKGERAATTFYRVSNCRGRPPWCTCVMCSFAPVTAAFAPLAAFAPVSAASSGASLVLQHAGRGCRMLPSRCAEPSGSGRRRPPRLVRAARAGAAARLMATTALLPLLKRRIGAATSPTRN